MRNLFRENRKYLSPAVLVLANLVPVVGVLFWNWEVFIILLLYCTETFIIGLYNFFKILLARKSHWGLNIFLSIFFLFHFNLFVLVQTVFVVVFSQIDVAELSSETEENQDFTEVIGAAETYMADQYLRESVLALIISHGFSFFVNYLVGGEFRRADAGKLMLAPYGRIVVQQLTVIFGGFALLLFSVSADVFLVMLILLKTGLDMRSHFRQHQKLRPT